MTNIYRELIGGVSSSEETSSEDIKMTDIDKNPSISMKQRIIKSFTNLEGKNCVLGIFLVATILTIFELVFFYQIVAPGVISKMNNNMSKLGDNLSTLISDKDMSGMDKYLDKLSPTQKSYIDNAKSMIFNKVSYLTGILKTLSIREGLLSSKINTTTKIHGSILVIMLSLFCAAMAFLIYKQAINEDSPNMLKNTGLTAILTVIILIVFQYWFYLYGLKYKYPVENEQLNVLVMERINTN
jgi:uncharacterized membrane protein